MILCDVVIDVRAWTASLDHERVLGQIAVEDLGEARAAAEAAFPEYAGKGILRVVPVEVLGPALERA